MAENETNLTKPSKPPKAGASAETVGTTSVASAGDGFTAPIADPGEGNVPDHINEHTLMVKGIEPDTKERLAVSLVALKKEFGDEKGLEKYKKVARLGGFFDPNFQPGGEAFYPDLVLEGMNPDIRAKVDAILK